MSQSGPARWEALDLLRGLSVIGMLLNLAPGAWNLEYAWEEHAKWEGIHAIDLVAPAFLFCVGAALPFSLASRARKGATALDLVWHVLWRAAALVAIGLFLNAYPNFDWATMRVPGVLQRIGLAYAVAGLFAILIGKRDATGLRISPNVVSAAIVFILISYWVLLAFVPVPGFGAPRFDPVGSWPAYLDRIVFTPAHMFMWWPVDGKIVFDPEGLLSTWPAVASVLVGTVTGLYYRKSGPQPVKTALAGAVAIVLAVAIQSHCPIIKNLWTSTFVFLSSGIALVLLAGFEWIGRIAAQDGWFMPLRVFGANPLLAYMLCFLASPWLDYAFLHTGHGQVSIRAGGEALLSRAVDPAMASFLFSLIYVAATGLVLWYCYRRRWFLKL